LNSREKWGGGKEKFRVENGKRGLSKEIKRIAPEENITEDGRAGNDTRRLAKHKN